MQFRRAGAAKMSNGARASARFNPNSEIGNRPDGAFRGACASGVWFSASRRKLRQANFSPLEFADMVWDPGLGVTPELARGTRALPISVSVFGFNLRCNGMLKCPARFRFAHRSGVNAALHFPRRKRVF